jgi:hypothetical protein
MNEYIKQATDFLTKTNTTLVVEYLRHGKHFEDDKENRDIYECTLKRGDRQYMFEFGQSLNGSGFFYMRGKRRTEIDRKYLLAEYKKNLMHHIGIESARDFNPSNKSDYIHYPKEPNAYDIFACMQKYDIGTFEDFCTEFGYDTDSKKAEKIYKAVEHEYIKLCSLFSPEEMEELQEIQ